MTRLALNEIFSPSNKIHREVGRTKDYPIRMRRSWKNGACDRVVLGAVG